MCEPFCSVVSDLKKKKLSPAAAFLGTARIISFYISLFSVMIIYVFLHTDMSGHGSRWTKVTNESHGQGNLKEVMNKK